MARTQQYLLCVLAFVCIQRYVSTACPKTCMCHAEEGRQIVNCTTEKELDVATIPSDTVELIFNCSLTLWKPLLLPYLSSLENLFLKNCGIDKIPLEPQNLPNLKILHLTNNVLVTIPENLPWSLKSVVLSTNAIETITAESFVGLKRLEEIFLDNNLIVEITNDSFTYKSNRKERATPPSEILVNLRKLALNKNKIESITSSAFKNLVFLNALNLARNRISKIQYSTFEGLLYLEHLDLSKNIILTIEDDSFQQMRYLKYLNLQHNRLTVVPRGLPMMTWLDISHNHIKFISDDHKPEFYAIETLTMGHNPFHCDCNLIWLKEFYDRREYQKKYEKSDDFIPVCSSPLKLLGESWDLLDDAVFTCDVINDVSTGDSQTSFDPSLLTVKSGNIGDTFITVDWSIKGSPPAPTVVIHFYIFGERTATLKYVELAVIQRGYTLKHLKPDSNYVVCVTPKISNNVESLSLSPLSMNHCIEVRTQREHRIEMLSYFWIFCYYVLGMAGTIVCLFILIGALALLGSVFMKNTDWSAKYVEIDEPIINEKLDLKTDDGKVEQIGSDVNSVTAQDIESKPHID